MTDDGTSARGTGDVRRFYDSLAPDYDLMTSFDERFVKERPWFEAIVSKFAVRSALDAGCGTGFHSILLSRLGVTVAGVDASPAMIERARENARRLNSAVTLHTGAFSEISSIMEGVSGSPGQFDAVFCLGNTLVHCLTDALLGEALLNFRSVLRPGGVLVVQILNYDRILSEKKELLGKREAGGMTFERRYSYQGETVTFTVTRGERMDSVTLRPLTRGMLETACTAAGFRDVSVFGDLAMGMFNPAVSTDLVLTALRPAARS
jgi:glycine/sarcosine N-methyltransferase